MSIRNDKPMSRRPTHPGELLREDFLPEYGLTVAALATAAGVTRQTMHELLRERRAVSPEMALRLSRVFGTTAEFWLDLQRNVDLWDAERALGRALRRVRPLVSA